MTEIEEWVRALLDKPYARELFGMEFVSARAGAVTLALPHRPVFEHAPGYFQGTITSALGELAASYSAVTLSTRDWSHATLEQSIRFLGPARGTRLIAEGRVIKAGRSISFAAADIFVEDSDHRALCAALSMTMHHKAPR